jgi:hypothetical protein
MIYRCYVRKKPGPGSQRPFDGPVDITLNPAEEPASWDAMFAKALVELDRDFPQVPAAGWQMTRVDLLPECASPEQTRIPEWVTLPAVLDQLQDIINALWADIRDPAQDGIAQKRALEQIMARLRWWRGE